MKGKLRQHGADFKAGVALAALKGDRTINEVASHYEVHPSMVISWKKQVLEELPGVFSGKTPRGEKVAQAEQGRSGSHRRGESLFGFGDLLSSSAEE